MTSEETFGRDIERSTPLTMRIWCGMSAMLLAAVLTSGVLAQQPLDGARGAGAQDRQGADGQAGQGGRQGRAGGIPIWEAPPLLRIEPAPATK